MSCHEWVAKSIKTERCKAVWKAMANYHIKPIAWKTGTQTRLTSKTEWRTLLYCRQLWLHYCRTAYQKLYAVTLYMMTNRCSLACMWWKKRAKINNYKGDPLKKNEFFPQFFFYIFTKIKIFTLSKFHSPMSWNGWDFYSKTQKIMKNVTNCHKRVKIGQVLLKFQILGSLFTKFTNLPSLRGTEILQGL